MVQETKCEKYFIITKSDVKKVGGDIKLLLWYSKLKDYASRISKDETGFIRVPPEMYDVDINMNRRTVRRYNKRLEDKGLIVVDKVKRGGRTWAGFRLV